MTSLAHRRLARDIDDALVWFAAVRAAGEAVAGPVGLSKKARTLERKLLRILVDGWTDAAEDAVARAVAIVAGGAGDVTPEELAEVLDLVGQRMGPGFAAAVGPAVRESLEASYKLGRNLYGRGGQRSSATFGLVDERAVGWLERDATYWVGGRYEKALSADIRAGAAAAILEGGLGRKAAGKELEKVLAGSLLDERVTGRKGYWEGLAAVVSTRARTFGAIEGMVEAEIEAFEIVAVMDERTSDICREMNGRIIPVSSAVAVRDRIMTAETPEDVKAISPWVSAPLAATKSSAQLASEGVCMPPFHFRCRTTVVSVSLTDDVGVGVDVPRNATGETASAVATLSPREMQNKLALMRAAPDQLLYVKDSRTRHVSQHGVSSAQFGEPFSNPDEFQRSAVETIQRADVVLASAGPSGERIYHFIDTMGRRHTVATDGGVVTAHNGSAASSDEEYAAWLAELRRTHAEVVVRAEGASVTQVHPEASTSAPPRQTFPARPTPEAVVAMGVAHSPPLDEDVRGIASGARPTARAFAGAAEAVFGERLEMPDPEALDRRATDWYESLTEDQRKAVRKWTRGGHREVSRGAFIVDPKNKKDRQEQKWAQDLLDAIATAPDVKGLVFRGIDRAVLANKAGVEIDPRKSGGKTYDVAFVEAASTDPVEALKYAVRKPDGALLMIESRSGKYIGAAAHEDWRHLKELLLTEPARFDIIAVVDHDFPVPDGSKVTRPVVFLRELAGETEEQRTTRASRLESAMAAVSVAIEQDIRDGVFQAATDEEMATLERMNNSPPYA